MNSLVRLTEPYSFEREYFDWRDQTFLPLAKKVGKELKKQDMSLEELKRDIKSAVKGGMLRPPEELLDGLKQESSPESFFQKYVLAWAEHDSFLFQNREQLLSDFPSPSFLGPAIANDQNVMGVTLVIPEKIDVLIQRIVRRSLGERVIYSPFSVFENHLHELGFNLHHAENIYYDTNNRDWSKLRSTLLDKRGLELTAKNLADCNSFLEENPSQEDAVRLFLRMLFWSGYEEQRRRFFVEYGVVDYFYRSNLFKSRQEELKKRGKGILTIKPEDVI